MTAYTWLGFTAYFNFFIISAVGILVYFKSQKTDLVKVFSVFCSFMTLWCLFYFFPFFPHNKNLTLLSFQLLHIPAAFIATANLHYITVFLDIYKKYRKIIFFGYGFNLVILFFIPTKLYIADMVPKFNFAYWANTGPVYNLWLSIWSAYVIFSMYLLIYHLIKSTGSKKQVIKYIFVGTLLTFSTGSSNFFYFYNINIPPYLNIFASFYIVTIAYAIARYHFMGVSSGILKYIQKIIAFAITVLVIFFGNYFIINGLHIKNNVFTSLFVILFTIAGFITLESFFNSRLFRRLFKINDFDEFKDVITHFYKKDLFYKDISELKQDIKNTFAGKLNIESVNLLILSKVDQGEYMNLISYFNKNQNEYLNRKSEGKYDEKIIKLANKFFRSWELCFPIFGRHENVIGFFVLGEKQYQNPYFNEEVDLVKTAVFHIALSVNIINYNKELKNDVATKTTQLNKKTEALKKMIKQQSDFIAVSAHELRTPLNIALLSSEFLEQQKIKGVDATRDALRKLQELTEKIFDVQQYDLERIRLSVKKVYMNEYLKSIYKEFENIFKEKNMKFTFNNELKEKVYAKIDPVQLHQVMLNLLINASKFTPAKGSVVLGVRLNGNELEVYVDDDGLGVPKSQREMVFHKFKSNHAYKGKGMGLGLYLCKKIIGLHKGKIWCESSPMGGGRFIFQIKCIM